jgi:hypothetical protein
LINLICSFSNGSESLNVESTPQTEQPYVRLGVTKESNNFSRGKKGKNLLNGLGHSYIINNINSNKLNLNTIKQRIHDRCLQTQNANICDSQKLNFFQNVYNMGQNILIPDVAEKNILILVEEKKNLIQLLS